MIPKNIHQIWLGYKKIPKHIREFMGEMKDKHKEYSYYLWSDNNLPDMPENLKEIFDSLTHPAMKSDLLRVYVLYVYGGVYLDVDYKLLTHLDDLNCYNEKDAYIVYQKHPRVEDFYCSIQISSKAGDFVSFMISKINEKFMWLGPHWYAECIYEYVGLEKHCNYQDILDRCPEHNLGFIEWEYIDKNVVAHDFLASWYPNSKWNIRMQSNEYE